MDLASTDPAPIPWESGVCDAHCHPTDTVASLDSIPKMKTSGMAIMATRFDDQERVALTARTYPSRVVPSFGIHPWFSHLLYDDRSSALDGLPDDDLKAKHYTSVLTPPPPDTFISSLPAPVPLSQFLSETRDRLLAFPHALVGEIGMDRSFRVKDPGSHEDPEQWRLSPHRVSIEHQKLVFRSQLAIAGELGRAVSVHGVGCHGALFDVFRELWKGYEIDVERRRDRMRRRRKKEDDEYEFLPDVDSDEEGDAEKSGQELARPLPFPPTICLHSFSGPPGQLRQYLKQPSPTKRYPSALYFSFSTTINANPDRGHLSKIEETIKAVPQDCLLIESDLHTAGDELDDALADAVRHVSRLKGWSIEDTVRRTSENWRRFVAHKG